MFALGTAQIGQAYGLTNRTGPPDEKEIRALVATAAEHGVLTFDTAQAYGDSEQLLGDALADLALGGRAKVISKISLGEGGSAEELLATIRVSLSNLKVPRLEGLLIHNDEAYPERIDALAEGFGRAISEGLIGGWGLSTYDPAKARDFLERTPGTLLQVPGNALDRRFARAGVMDLARDLKKDVYVRSVFLQGLLLCAPDAVPAKAPPVGEALKRLEAFCRANDLEQAAFVYRYVQDGRWGVPVLGAETAAQLAENVRIAESAPLGEGLREAWEAQWPEDDLDLIDPRRWPAH